jgi:hypothetical protein
LQLAATGRNRPQPAATSTRRSGTQQLSQAEASVTGLLVIIPVGAEPILIVDALTDTEARHLDDWLASSLVLVRAATALLALQRQLVEAEDDEPEAAA